MGVPPNLDAVFDEFGRDRFGIAPRWVDVHDRAKWAPPAHPTLSWTEQQGRSWNYWRGRSVFYLACLPVLERYGLPHMSPYPISFNSFKNVSWYYNTSREVEAIIATQASLGIP